MSFPKDYLLSGLTEDEAEEVKSLLYGFIGSLFAGLMIYYFLESREIPEFWR